jgi:hypothetical protein
LLGAPHRLLAAYGDLDSGVVALGSHGGRERGDFGGQRAPLDGSGRHDPALLERRGVGREGAAAVECSIDVFKKVQAFERGAVVVVPETAYPKATTAKRGAAAMSSMSTGTTSSKRTARDAAQEACCSAICGTKETLLMAVAVVEQARGALALAEQALEAADSAALMAETTWKFPPP